MKKTARFVIWICSKFIPLDIEHLAGFTREEIEEIIQGLLDVLANRNPEVKPKDDFKKNILITVVSLLRILNFQR